MKLEILQYPDARLKQKATPVMDVTPEIRQLAADMAETMYEHGGVGLAASQVGRPVRLVVMDLSGPSERSALRVLVNPALEPLPARPEDEDEVVETEEGCLSVPEYRSNVKRYARVRLKTLDLDGNLVEREASDLEAICLQHECDHLDGRLFIDHISRLKRGLYDRKRKKQSR